MTSNYIFSIKNIWRKFTNHVDMRRGNVRPFHRDISTSIIKWYNTTIKKDINFILSTEYHHPTNGSTSSYQWIINGTSSSYQWSISIILPMFHIWTSSSYEWSIIIILEMNNQWRIIILLVEHQHHPINGYKWSIIILSMERQHHSVSMNHQSLSYQWSINIINLSCRSIILHMDNHLSINDASFFIKSSPTASRPTKADIRTFVEYGKAYEFSILISLFHSLSRASKRMNSQIKPQCRRH